MNAVSDELLERDLQAKCVAWWSQSGLPGLLFHVPNEGKRNRLEAASLAALGVVAGVADFVLLLPGAQTHLIELKTQSGQLSDEQESFRANAENLDHDYNICRSLLEFSDLVYEVVGRAERLRLPVAGSLLEIGAGLPLP